MKLSNLAATATMCIVFAFMFLTIYWNFYPYHVIDFKYDKLPILNEGHMVHRGHPVLWQGDSIHNTNGIPVTVSRQIVCDTLINLPDVGYVTKRGAFHAVNSSVTIPDNAPLGKCHILNSSRWQINPIRIITIDKETEEFTVVP